jgi:hypothetical protein
MAKPPVPSDLLEMESAPENHAVLASALAAMRDHVSDLRACEWVAMCIVVAVGSLRTVATEDQHSHFASPA